MKSVRKSFFCRRLISRGLKVLTLIQHASFNFFKTSLTNTILALRFILKNIYFSSLIDFKDSWIDKAANIFIPTPCDRSAVCRVLINLHRYANDLYHLQVQHELCERHDYYQSSLVFFLNNSAVFQQLYILNNEIVERSITYDITTVTWLILFYSLNNQSNVQVMKYVATFQSCVVIRNTNIMTVWLLQSLYCSTMLPLWWEQIDSVQSLDMTSIIMRWLL